MAAPLTPTSKPGQGGGTKLRRSARLAALSPTQSAVDIWADLVVQVVRSHVDVPTLGAWAVLVGKSVGSLRLHCYAIHVSPRRTLLFARLLRAVTGAQGQRWDLGDWLHAADLRTLKRAAHLGGIPEADVHAPSVSDYLLSQQLLPGDSRALSAIHGTLDGHSAVPK
jgi:hypothetical protein